MCVYVSWKGRRRWKRKRKVEEERTRVGRRLKVEARGRGSVGGRKADDQKERVGRGS